MEYLSKVVITLNKLPFLTRVAVLLLSLFAPLRDVIHVIIFLVFVDMIASIYSQMQSCEKTTSFFKHIIKCFKVVESHKLRRSVSKMFFYVLVMAAFYVFDVYILHIHPLTPDTLLTFSITNIAAILICVTELTSITANISKITNNPIFHTIMKLFNKKLKENYNIDPNPEPDEDDENTAEPQAGK